MENKKENRAFNEMYIAAKKRLEGKNPIEWLADTNFTSLSRFGR